jgi:hypothetical protein
MNSGCDANRRVTTGECRAAFEAWCSKDFPLEKSGFGYVAYSSDLGWLVWQASWSARREQKPVAGHPLSSEQMKHLVDRFLGWRLPKPWHPDNGIKYERPHYAHLPADLDWPTGTNLFDAEQAKAMLLYMIEGMPAPISEPQSPESTREAMEQVREALEIAAGYIALVADGVGKMPILKDRVKSDCEIIGHAIALLPAMEHRRETPRGKDAE